MGKKIFQPCSSTKSQCRRQAPNPIWPLPCWTQNSIETHHVWWIQSSHHARGKKSGGLGVCFFLPIWMGTNEIANIWLSSANIFTLSAKHRPRIFMRLQLGELLSIFMSVGLHGLSTVVWVQMSAFWKDAEWVTPVAPLGPLLFVTLGSSFCAPDIARIKRHSQHGRRAVLASYAPERNRRNPTRPILPGQSSVPIHQRPCLVSVFLNLLARFWLSFNLAFGTIENVRRALGFWPQNLRWHSQCWVRDKSNHKQQNPQQRFLRFGVKSGKLIWGSQCQCLGLSLRELTTPKQWFLHGFYPKMLGKKGSKELPKVWSQFPLTKRGMCNILHHPNLWRSNKKMAMGQNWVPP